MAWEPIAGETPIDPSGLKVRGVRTRAQLDALEFANVAKAIARHLAARPTERGARFDVAWCRRVHKDMFGDVWRWAGKFRRAESNIGLPWRQVETAMTEFTRDLHARAKHGEDVFALAVWVHFRAVQIHPFEGGNGRWSRLLSNIWLALHGMEVTLWPATLGAVSPIREEYLAAVREADGHDLRRLMELQRRYTAGG